MTKRPVMLVAGGLLIAMGAVWALQGLGSTFVPQSFMTNNRPWIVIGLTTMAAGIGLVAASRRRP